MPHLTREDVESAFSDLGQEAILAGQLIDLAVYGGAALLLTFPARPATRDVDAVSSGDTAFIRAAAQRIAQQRGWRDDWLNDAVKGFLSTRQGDTDTLTLFRTYPSETEPGLRVYLARPEYLLAMKCIAMRTGTPSSRDVDDIRMLISHLHLKTAAQVLDIVANYYPNRLIPPKTQFGVEEIFDSMDDKG